MKAIVLTGGPGAGKTAVLELVRHALCPHVQLVRESAAVVFGGGFPRDPEVESRRAAQRAIYRVQRELEVVARAKSPIALLCDRGTIDGSAYWAGPGELWDTVGSERAVELARYATVIHLRTPRAGEGYNHANPLRIETAAEAAAIDDRIAFAWRGHPDVHEVPTTVHFLDKAARAIEIIRAAIPACPRCE